MLPFDLFFGNCQRQPLYMTTATYQFAQTPLRSLKKHSQPLHFRTQIKNRKALMTDFIALPWVYWYALSSCRVPLTVLPVASALIFSFAIQKCSCIKTMCSLLFTTMIRNSWNYFFIQNYVNSLRYTTNMLATVSLVSTSWLLGIVSQAYKISCESRSMSKYRTNSDQFMLVSGFLFTFCNYASFFQGIWMLAKYTES